MLTRMTIASFLLVVSLGSYAPAGAFAATAGPGGITYALITPPSELEYGCQGPCECAAVAQPNYGSFELVPAGTDTAFASYDVPQFIASYNNGPGAVMILGSGHYRLGLRAPAMQQLELDLEVEGRPVQHFDSGLVPVTVAFPRIDVRASVNDFTCLDTVIVVSAHPASTGVGPGAIVPGLTGVRPNPFSGRADISYALDRSGPATLVVCDVSGRRVRQLVDAGGEPGPRSVAWDGRRDDGRAAPAGVYWIRLAWPGGADQRRIVKLD